MWHDPPDEVASEWHAAADQAFRGRGPSSCPTGDGGTLRYFFARYGEPPRDRGGFWIWCPICGSYEHGSASVPAWWRDVDVPPDALMHDPGWLDDHWDDEWLKS